MVILLDQVGLALSWGHGGVAGGWGRGSAKDGL